MGGEKDGTEEEEIFVAGVHTYVRVRESKVLLIRGPREPKNLSASLLSRAGCLLLILVIALIKDCTNHICDKLPKMEKC